MSSTSLSILNLGVGIVISSSSARLTSIAILITNEFITKLKIGYGKLRNCINVITLLSDKTVKKLMVVKKLMEKKLMNKRMSSAIILIRGKI